MTSRIAARISSGRARRIRAERDQHGLQAWVLCANPLEGLEAAQPWHRDVEDHEVGPVLLDLLEHFLAVRRFSADLDVVFPFEDVPNPLTNDAVIVCDQDGDHP
jgi:hypothetical protein